jgi:hypothetical protein
MEFYSLGSLSLLLLVLPYGGRPFYKSLGQQKFMMSQFISWALTFGSVIPVCLFFMETNTHHLVQKLQVLVTPWNCSLSNLAEVFSFLNENGAAALVFTLLLSTGLLFMEQIGVWRQGETEYNLLVSPWISLLLLVLLYTGSPFIYFDF